MTSIEQICLCIKILSSTHATTTSNYDTVFPSLLHNVCGALVSLFRPFFPFFVWNVDDNLSVSLHLNKKVAVCRRLRTRGLQKLQCKLEVTWLKRNWWGSGLIKKLGYFFHLRFFILFRLEEQKQHIIDTKANEDELHVTVLTAKEVKIQEFEREKVTLLDQIKVLLFIDFLSFQVVCISVQYVILLALNCRWTVRFSAWLISVIF